MGATRTGSLWARWFSIAAIWSGIALFDATQTVFTMRSEGMHHAWARLFLTLMLSWLPWALATPLIIYLGRLYPPIPFRRISAWFIHLGTAASIGLVSAAWGGLLEALLNPWAQSTPSLFRDIWPLKFYNGLLSSFVLYAFILTICLVLDSRERLAIQQTEAARLNEQLSREQLRALRRQIEPHFLFNTLNAIAGLVREKRNEAAISMIVGLSDFLRRAVEDSNRQQVPLEAEMEFLERYLEIQKLRFAERLQLTIDVPKELLPSHVPSWTLQPLVENAIKHGIAKRAQGGVIRIAASRANGRLSLSVYNDGPLLEEGWEKTRCGIGVSNLRARLESLYGNSFELRMGNRGSEGVEVSISLPYKEK